MNNITVTISASSNITQAYGYDPKFYEGKMAQYADIVKDLREAKNRLGDDISFVSVTTWSEPTEAYQTSTYSDINEVIAIYQGE